MASAFYQIRQTRRRKRISIVDIGRSFKSCVSSFQIVANDNRIILLYLPPHTTHKFQPLDVGQFGPLAQYYGQFFEDHVKFGFDVSKREYTDWILQARRKENSESDILSSFRKTGLVPFDPDVVLKGLKHPKKWPHSQEDQADQPFEQVEQ